MANRALKIDDSQFELPGVHDDMPDDEPVADDGADGSSGAAPAGRSDLSPDAAIHASSPEGAPAAADGSAGEALAVPPDGAGAGTRAGDPAVPDLGPVGVLAGEDAMVRAFNQLRAAVRDATRDEVPDGAAPPAVQPGAAEAVPPPAADADRAHADNVHVDNAHVDRAHADGAGAESLVATGTAPMREDALFAFGPGSGRVFLSGGAGWTDVVRLQDIAAPPDGRFWNLDLQSGTATEVDGAILLSEDASGTVRLADGAELIFSGIERIEW